MGTSGRVIVRDATPADAVAAGDVMRASITELCAADHHNDPQILSRWLANKTPEVFAAWLADPGASLLVAAEGESILAVDSVRNDGEITLNYVAPNARFRGVSSALLKALEKQAAERGNSRCKLVSTVAAHRFYLARGYADPGAPERRFGNEFVLSDVETNLSWEVRCRKNATSTGTSSIRPNDTKISCFK